MKLLIYIVIFLVFILIGCNASKSSHNFSQIHYEKLGSNINRLMEMKKGVFVQYLYDPTGERETELWTVNEGKDSTVLVVRQVGNPNKDGYWLFSCHFITNLPDLPLSMAFHKYEVSPNSRDTIYGREYHSPTKIDWKNVFDPNYKFTDIDFTSLVASNNIDTYVRKDLMEFRSSSNFKKTRTLSDRFNLRKDYYTISPQKSLILVRLYKDDEKSPPYDYPAVQMLVKLPRNNVFYPKHTAYKNK